MRSIDQGVDMGASSSNLQTSIKHKTESRVHTLGAVT